MLAQEHGYLDRAQEMSLTRYFSTEPASLSSLSSEISTNSGLSWQPIDPSRNPTHYNNVQSNYFSVSMQ